MKYNFSDNFDIYEIHYQTEETKKMLIDINKLTNFKNIRTNNQKVLNYLKSKKIKYKIGDNDDFDYFRVIIKKDKNTHIGIFYSEYSRTWEVLEYKIVKEVLTLEDKKRREYFKRNGMCSNSTSIF